MIGHRTTSRGKEYHYYECAFKNRVYDPECEQKRFARDKLEDWVSATIKEKVFSESARQEMAEFLSKEYNDFVKTIFVNTKSLSSEKAMAERKLNNLYKLVENGDADEFIIDRINKLKKEIKEIKEKIIRLNKMNDIPVLSEKEILDTLNALYDNVYLKADHDSRQILIDLFVHKVILTNKKISLQITTERVFSLVGAEGSCLTTKKTLRSYEISYENYIAA
jgi:hypothetical protein